MHTKFRPLYGHSIVTAVFLGLIGWPMLLSAQASDMEAATAALEWREVGPTIMGGRVADVAVVESNPSIFYVGTAHGGLWKTINAGTSFEPIFDDQPTPSIGDVTIAPSNPNVVWVGSGEPQNRQSSPWGMGVFRSTDAGMTWNHLGLEETQAIGRIQVHPRNPDVAYVAAVGHLWGPNPERGVYRTTDGGETWDHVLFIDEHTGAIDLAMDPGDPKTLFAATYQRQRTLWGFNGGGPGSGIYRTTDGGDNWAEMTDGLPQGDKGRIGLDIYRRDGNLVYAIVEADARVPGGGRFSDSAPDRESGVYRSDDRGLSWTQVNTTNSRPMYYSHIRIDPNDPERIYLGGTQAYRSSDGGNTFTPDASLEVHSDHHAIWIDPSNSNHMILAGDGGVSISWDRSDSWRQLTNLPIATFYEIGVDNRDPYHVCGGLQDNGAWCAPSDTWSNQNIRSHDWYNVGGGDGYHTILHPDGGTMLAESQNGNIMRVNLATDERLRMQPVGRPSINEEGEEEEASYRWNWNSAMVVSAHDPNTIYYGGNHVFKSTDYGQVWEEISPDLTSNIDRTTLEIMGVLGSEPMMSANDGTSYFGNIVGLAESPIDPNVLYAGSDDGNLHVTRDGGTTWTNVAPNMPGLPYQTYITRIVASHADAGTVWAAGDNHRNDDFTPYIYSSSDFGQSWRLITNGLPDNWSVNALQQHPRAADLLFTGTEHSVYFSVDAGATWLALKQNLPPVAVDDIQIQARENDLVIGTHGRGIWIMEDITPLEEMSQAVLTSNAHLFSTQKATVYNQARPQGWTPGAFEVSNPPMGARIRYWLGQDLASDAASEDTNSDESQPGHANITILNADGDVVRELEGGGEHGLNEVIWDLRYAPPGEAPDGGSAFRGTAQAAPKVMPGVYTARLHAGGETLDTSVEVRLDPRVNISRRELIARQDALMSAYELTTPVNEGLRAIGRIRDQLSDVRDRLEGHDVLESLNDEIDAVGDEIDEINDELGKARRGSSVSASLGSYYTAPTADHLHLLERGWGALPDGLRRLNALITDRMPTLHQVLNDAGVRPDLGDPIKVPVPPRR